MGITDDGELVLAAWQTGLQRGVRLATIAATDNER